MTEMMKKLHKLGIVPVVVLETADDALPLAERLIKGGLPCAEVTFRTAAAEESIRHDSQLLQPFHHFSHLCLPLSPHPPLRTPN